MPFYTSPKRRTSIRIPSWPMRTICIAGLLAACTLGSQPSKFDPKQCLETVPARVDGLQILAGPRTARNIIRDMVPAICNGQVLFRRMKSAVPHLHPGTVHFRVVVEYTGEVLAVSIEETTITSQVFLREVSDFVMDSDFTPWARSDADSVFLYPALFGY